MQPAQWIRQDGRTQTGGRGKAGTARGGGIEERFQQYDRNGDGKLTPAEFPMSSFKQVDKNNDGVVTLDEARAYYGGPPPASQSGEMKMKTVVLSVITWLRRRGVDVGSGPEPATGAPPVSVEQRFKQWDQNGDGKLTPDEVPGEKLFKMLDKNGDGIVTQEEANAFGGGGRRAAGGKARLRWNCRRRENFKPRPHGDEAKAAGLKPDVLAKIDVEMQRHVAAPDVAGVIGLIHKNGVRGYFEAFGMQDIEAAKPMPNGRDLPPAKHEQARGRGGGADAAG